MELTELFLERKNLKNLAKKEEEKIDELEKKIEWHKKRRNNLWWKTSFTKTILNPLCEEIVKRTDFVYYEVWGAFGLQNEYSLVFSHEKGKTEVDKSTFLHIIPEEKDGDIIGILYWNGEEKNEYEKGSIGEMNGFNKVYIKLPMFIDEIIEIINSKRKGD